ncbi:MAG TPA: hypothetical protein VG694_02425 [Candidatus Paceibacterota bacterium]|nr:hypothetical protein [Candidatus Paceibacterota bacterium]
MDRKKLLIRTTSLAFFIFFVNFIAMKFHWYYSMWWFDMPMHFVGGFWAGLLVACIYPPEDVSFKSVFKFALLVLAIGIAWEIFEIFIYDYFKIQPFNTLDTISDILFDISGGLLSIIYISKRIMLSLGGAVQNINNA